MLLFVGLSAGIVVFSIERGLNMVLLREDFGDFRFHPWAHPGRKFESLHLTADLQQGCITISNASERTLQQVRLTTKLFAGSDREDRPVFELDLPDLAPREVRVLRFDRAPFDVEEGVLSDLGMIEAMVSCDRGMAFAFDWSSYWS